VSTVTADGAGAWQSGLFGGLDLPPLGGTVQVTATATDRFGNPGTPQVRPIQVEGIPLAVTPEALSATELLSAGDAPVGGAASIGTDASVGPPAPSPIQPFSDPLLAIHNPLPHLG